jgi:hypothetical protein
VLALTEEVLMKYLNDDVMEQVSGGAMNFVPTFLVVGENSPQGTHTVDAPVPALKGADNAIAGILNGPGNLSNISSPYVPL